MAKTYNDINLLAYVRGEFQPWDEQEKRFNTQDNKARLITLKETADQYSASFNQLVLSYVMNTEPGIIPVFDASSLEQLNNNLQCLSIPWTQELENTLKNAGC